MKFRYFAAILAVLLLGFALRTWHLNTESIWHDEAWSIRAIHGPFTTPDDNTPFIYYFSGHLLWRLGGGDTPLALRYISVLWGVLTIALAVQIGRRWLGNGPGLVFGGLIATSPLLWEYAQEVRAYVVVPLIALAMLALAERILRYHKAPVPRLLWVMVLGVELFGLYTHNLAVPLIIWLNGALGCAWLLRRDWDRMLTWAGLQIALIIAYIPWLLTQSPSGTPLNTPPEPGLTLIRDVWTSYFLPALTQFEQAIAGTAAGVDLLPVLNVLGIMLLVIAVISSITRFDRRVWLLLTYTFTLPVFTTALMLAANIDFHPRYYIASVPGTLLLFVYGVSQIKPITFRRIAVIGTAGLFFGVSAGSLHQITTTRTYQHDDFASLAAYYDSLPPDAVILIPFDDEPALQYYFDRVLAIDAQMVNVPLYSDEATAIEVINGLDSDHVELLTWFQLPADARGMYPCLLTAASITRPGNPQTYFGLMTQQFTVDNIALQPLTAAPNYRNLAFERGAYATSPYGTCVRTMWSLLQPTDQDVQLATTLIDPFDQPLGRDDTQLTRDDNAGTSNWNGEDTGSAYNLVHVPAGIPLNDYALVLNAYSDTQPSGYDLLDDAGNPTGVDYRIADALAVQGAPIAIDGPQLVAVGAETLYSGEAFTVTVDLPNDQAVVTLNGDSWSVEATSSEGRNWLTFAVPADAQGQATLLVGDEVVATYSIEAVERVLQPPDFGIPLDVQFVDVGTLVGTSIAQTDILPDPPPQITLIWRAAGDVQTDYTVFVQLLSPDGQVIAQSDRQPSNGTRPTSSWVNGEYIIDPHTLRFNLPDYRGEATLIAGLYNPADFVRVPTADGSDRALLPTILTITAD